MIAEGIITLSDEEQKELEEKKRARLEADRVWHKMSRDRLKQKANEIAQIVSAEIGKIQPLYRITYNKIRKENRRQSRRGVETAAQKTTRLDYNLNRRTKMQQKTKDERRRKYPTLEFKLQVLARIKKQRGNLMLRKRMEIMQAMMEQMHTDANVSYLRNQKLRQLICTPEASIINYLGQFCKMDVEVARQMDQMERLGLFLQLKRVNELYNAQQIGKRENETDRSAHIVSHFHALSQAFNQGAINKVLETFFKKAIRDEAGACGRLSLTTALNGQAFRSCNLTGFQALADSMNRNEGSGEGIMPSRNTLQQCGDEISTGTKAIVAPSVDDDHRVYRVNLIDELTNVTNVSFIRSDQSLPTDLVDSNLDSTYQGAPQWNGCVVKVDTSNKDLMAAIKAKSIDINFSCDGFEMASASNGGVGFIAIFKGKEVLQHLHADYAKQKDNPEYGDRAGCHSVNSVLWQGLAIGPDDFEMSRRLTEESLKLVQELHRPGRIFRNPETGQYFAFKTSITVDKKEGCQITVTGGGTYLTKFFDIYTDDNQETKGLMSWRQCDDCFDKGKRE
jgi:hypothetical protein